MTYRQKNRYEVTVGGKLIAFETGDLAKLAGGAVSVTLGESVLLATATMSKSIREGIDFFPLSVDFEERMYAAGRIPGSFFRREGRPTTDAILTSRLIDRPLRPLFPKGFRNDVQIDLHGPQHRRREPTRYPGHQCGFGCAHDLRYSL